MSVLKLVPSEKDFLAAFGVEPIEARPNDGYWCYVFDAGSGLTLTFSFCTHDGSVQTRLTVQDRVVSTVSHEGASVIEILDRGETASIKVRFECAHTLTTLLIEVLPAIRLTWASLGR